MRWLDGTTDLMDMGLGRLRVGDGQGGLVCYKASLSIMGTFMGSQRVGHK